MMIEEIPLTLVLHNAVMVRPATVGLLGHNESFVLIGSHRILAHGVGEDFGFLPYIRVRQVVIAVVFKCKGTFRLTVRQVFQAVDAIHFKLTLAPLHFFFRGIVCKFLHVVFQFCAASGSPEDVSIAIGRQEDTGIDAADALDGLWLAGEGTFGTVCRGHTDAEAPTVFRC